MTITEVRRPLMSVGPAKHDGPRPMKTAERVAGDIVHEIVADGLGTGDRLPLEAAMVDKYHASRSSVREALRLLEVQGLISLKPGPGGGPVVGWVDPAHLARTSSLYFHLGGATYESVLRTQAMFEPICAQLAALNPSGCRRWSGSSARLRPAPWGSTAATMSELHAAIHRLAANPIIAMLTQAIGQHRRRSRRRSIPTQPLYGPGAPNVHAALARAVAAGEAETAGRLMFGHVRAQHDHYGASTPSSSISSSSGADRRAAASAAAPPAGGPREQRPQRAAGGRNGAILDRLSQSVGDSDGGERVVARHPCGWRSPRRSRDAGRRPRCTSATARPVRAGVDRRDRHRDRRALVLGRVPGERVVAGPTAS